MVMTSPRRVGKVKTYDDARLPLGRASWGGQSLPRAAVPTRAPYRRGRFYRKRLRARVSERSSWVIDTTVPHSWSIPWWVGNALVTPARTDRIELQFKD